MSYYKQLYGGCITAIGVSSAAVAENEITQAEYSTLLDILHAKPTPPEGYGYRLTEALAWEQYALPATAESELWTQEELSAMTNAELERLLYGYGLSGSMNKANMIRLILAAQGGAVT